MLLTRGEVLGHKKYGEHYHSLTIVAPEIGEKVQPGQFVNIRCGEGSAHILRRPFSVYRVHKRGGWASTIEIVFDIRGAGTEYLSHLRPHMMVDLVGPLGRGFALPKGRAHCLLVGGGIGAAPLFFLADDLQKRRPPRGRRPRRSQQPNVAEPDRGTPSRVRCPRRDGGRKHG